MAIAFRSVATATDNGTSVTVTKPSGVVSGDVLIAIIFVFPDGPAPTFTDPSGWTVIKQVDQGDEEVVMRMTRKVAGGSEPSNYTWSMDEDCNITAAIVAYTGVDNTTPIDVNNGQWNSNSASITAPSITTTVANTMLVGGFGVNDDTSITPAFGMTERSDVSDADSVTLEVAEQVHATASATGTRVATAARGGDNVGILCALKPVGGAALVKISTKTEQISEQARVLLDLVRKHTETEQISEQARVTLDLIRKQTSTEQIPETARAQLAIVQSTGGFIGVENIIESIRKSIGKLIVATETEQISEQSRVLLTLVRKVTETENISELSRVLLTLTRILTETEQVSEQARVLLSLVRKASETENIVESAIAFISGTIILKSVLETEQISEQSRVLLTLVRRVTESESIAEQTRALLSIVRIATETENLVENVISALAIRRKVTETEELIEQARVVMDLTRATLTTEEIAENTVVIRGLTRVAALETEQISEQARHFIENLRFLLETESIVERARFALFIPLLAPPQTPGFNPLLGAVSPTYTIEFPSPITPVYSLSSGIAPVYDKSIPGLVTKFFDFDQLIDTGLEAGENQGEEVFKLLGTQSSFGNMATAPYNQITNPRGLRAIKLQARTSIYGPGDIPDIKPGQVRTKFWRVADETPEILERQLKFKIVYSFWWGLVSQAGFIDLRLELLHPSQVPTPPTGVVRIDTFPFGAAKTMVLVEGVFTPEDEINGVGGDYALRWETSGTVVSGGGSDVAIDDVNISIVPIQEFPTYTAAHGTPVQI